MRKGKLLWIAAMCAMVGIGCGDDDDDGSTGNGQIGTGQPTAGVGGPDWNGSDGNGSGGNEQSCDQTDPNGRQCSDADDCMVECDCSSHHASMGSCVGQICQNSPSDCGDLCEGGGGSYTGNYCFLGGDSGGSTDTGGTGNGWGDETDWGDDDGWNGTF